MIATTDRRPRGLPVALMLVLALGACAEARAPDPTPTKDGGPYNMIDPVPDPAATAGAEQDQGSWRSSRLGSEPVLVFANRGPEAVLRIRCDGRRGLVIERVGVSSVGPAQLMEIGVGSEVARLAVNRTAESTSVRRAIVPYNHPLMKQLASDEGSVRVALGKASAVTAPLNQDTKQFVLTCATSTP